MDKKGVDLAPDSYDNTVNDNDIHDNDEFGIWIGGSRDNTISNNQIYGNGVEGSAGIGIGAGGCSEECVGDVSGNEITDNNIYDNHNGIYLGGDDIFFEELTISGNTIEENLDYGIYFDQIFESVLDILNNTIINNGLGGIYLSGFGGTIQSSTVTIEDNDVSSNGDGDGGDEIGGNGIYADVIIDSTFEVINNTVNNNSEKGIYLCAEGYCENSTVTVSENQVSGNGSTGIYFNDIEAGSVVTISDNSVEGNSQEIELTTGIYIYYIYNSTVDILDNDILENSGVGLYIDTIESGEIEIGEDETLVNISGNEITGNTGYGIYMNNVSLNDGGEVNIGPNNTVSDNGDTGIYLDHDVSGVSIFMNTILNNNEEFELTGIYIAEDGNEVHFNRIAGNGVGLGVTGEMDSVFVNAENNWWGCNAGPDDEDCDSVDVGIGSVDYSPWLTLRISASPDSIFVGGETSNIAGTLTINSDDDDTSEDGNIPDGTLIFFETTLGSIGSTSVYKTTTDGVAAATLTSEDEGGMAEVSATLDNQTVSTEVDIEEDANPPTGSWVNPEDGDTIQGTITLEVDATDDISGVQDVEFQYKRNDGVDTFHTIATDSTNTYSADWDTTGLVLDEYTLRAILTDNVGNSANLDIEVDVAAVVSNEDSTTPSTNSAVVIWTTDRATSSRVVYDTASHNLGSAPNYGYAFSTGTTDTSPKVTSHSVTITGLSAGTTYYYRTVSEGSPKTVGDEHSFQTLSNAGAGAPGGGGGGAVAGAATVAPSAFFAPLLGFLTPEEVSAEEVLGEDTEEVSPSPEPTVEGAEALDRNWLWLLLLVIPLGLGYYYYQKKSR